jgi:NDP-sugar pyrophosphorylase family protein
VTTAVVLAAGPGSRLGDLGVRMPKTMLPVAGRPYLEQLTGRLLRSGLWPVVVAVNHHEQMIRDYFSDHPYAPDLRFVRTRRQGTGADLIQCLEQAPTEEFIVWNGDTIVDLDVRSLLERHGEEGRPVIVLTQRPDAPNRNAWYVDADDFVIGCLEAVPRTHPPITYAWRGSSTGVVFLTKTSLAAFDGHGQLDLYSTVLPALMTQKVLKAHDNGTRYFLDFGTPNDLARIDHSHVSGWIL